MRVRRSVLVQAAAGSTHSRCVQTLIDEEREAIWSRTELLVDNQVLLTNDLLLDADSARSSTPTSTSATASSATSGCAAHELLHAYLCSPTACSQSLSATSTTSAAAAGAPAPESPTGAQARDPEHSSGGEGADDDDDEQQQRAAHVQTRRTKGGGKRRGGKRQTRAAQQVRVE